MKIIYLMRSSLHIYPPCISQLLLLRDLDMEVIVGYGECNKDTADLLNSRNITCVSFDIKRKWMGILSKIKAYKDYRKKTISFLKEYYKEGDVVWFGSADSCFALRRELNSYRFVLSVLELYDNNSFYRRNLQRVIHKAKIVIACENNRAAVMRSWWKLPHTPYVMPNKPYFHPRKRYITGSLSCTRDMINDMETGINILYQGIISADRDLIKLAQALNNMDMEINLYLMGRDNYDAVARLKKLYSKTYYLGSAPAPYHLEVTSHAYIGVANYDYSCLNNIFCAPNKIYEYCGFGIPVLANDVPGLRNTIERYQAGICVDFDKVEQIETAIVSIVNDYQFYSRNASELYNSVNNMKIMKEILYELKKK